MRDQRQRERHHDTSQSVCIFVCCCFCLTQQSIFCTYATRLPWVGKEVCSSQLPRDPGWWKFHLDPTLPEVQSQGKENTSNCMPAFKQLVFFMLWNNYRLTGSCKNSTKFLIGPLENKHLLQRKEVLLRPWTQNSVLKTSVSFTTPSSSKDSTLLSEARGSNVKRAGWLPHGH